MRTREGKDLQIVVTGASGFLGDMVVRNLATRGVEVVPVSRRPLPGSVRVADYADTPGGDVLVHLAEERDRAVAERQGEGCERGSARVMAALLQKRWRRVIYASSAALYGDAECSPRKTRDVVEASDAYSRLKLAGERAVLGSRIGAVARLANLYGPGMAESNVVSAILRQIDGEGPLVVRDTAPVRDFIWVGDAAEAIARMAMGGARGLFNVGSGNGVSVGALAALALKLAGRDDRQVRSSEPGERRSCIVLDISETVATWAWGPETDLERGLGLLLRDRIASVIGRRE